MQLGSGKQIYFSLPFFKFCAINRSIWSTFSYTNDIKASYTFLLEGWKFLFSSFFAVIFFNLNYRVRNIVFNYCSATSNDISFRYIYSGKFLLHCAALQLFHPQALVARNYHHLLFNFLFTYFFSIKFPYLRNKSWKPECEGRFNIDWRILVFYPEPEARDKIY